MKKTLFVIVASILVLLGMEWLSWKAFRSSDDRAAVPLELSDETISTARENPPGEATQEESAAAVATEADSATGFPAATVEVVNGRSERTIHMGVRQYVWEPATVTVKRGELVRLIIHNADVLHGLVIPELGVNQDIPPDGAVIEFVASKVGTFEFFCSIWCGEGHMEMRGKLVVE